MVLGGLVQDLAEGVRERTGVDLVTTDVRAALSLCERGKQKTRSLAGQMKSAGSSFWSSGSVPLIEPEFLSSIIAVASDIALVITQDGDILSVLINQQDTSFGKLDHWEGRSIRNFLTAESIPKLDAVLTAFARGDAPRKAVELNHSDNAIWEFPIRYSFHPFGNDKSLLMLAMAGDHAPAMSTMKMNDRAQSA